jgi:hypothetical protein
VIDTQYRRLSPSMFHVKQAIHRSRPLLYCPGLTAF